MASNYEAIRADNERRYGTDVGRWGKTLLTDLYDDRAHFIYELLQNAEDALRRRSDDPRDRAVRFHLSERALRVSHYGKPFDRRDVEGVCGIALSTRDQDLTRIGRFGIGFKSVYCITDRPEVHSGDEDFGIDRFVWPSAQPAIERDPDQTIFLMPLRHREAHGAEVAEGLRRISLDTLLFLREIDTIEWSVPNGQSGICVRESKQLDQHVQRVALIGESTGLDDTDQEWLVFSTPMHGGDDEYAGHVEVAFRVENDRILPVSDPSLVVFFPTTVKTNLGLSVQGPYRTTPNRHNVPKDDPWNQACVARTGDVLVDALLWLREQDMLDVDVLRCLPLDEAKFGDGSMFAPLFEKVKDAMFSHRLLPLFGGGFAAAGEIKIARSGDLRELFAPAMLPEIFSADGPVYWLTEDITDRSTPELASYLREVLHVDEVRPVKVIRALSRSHLERQSVDWIRRLYEFMNVQRELHWQAKEWWPLVRLSDGCHVIAYVDGTPRAYLPGEDRTNFPTVHPEVCSTDESMRFLEAIDLSPPDPVEDVIRNVLPKYSGGANVDGSRYAEDIARMSHAFQTDSTVRRDELVAKLSETCFVYSVDGGTGEWWARPDEVYFKTDRLAALFDGVEGVLFVDSSRECLRGEEVRSMLEACGASRYLRSREAECTLAADELRAIRRKAGLEDHTRDDISDRSLRGVDLLLDHMSGLGTDERQNRAAVLWEALADVADRTPGALDGTYRWHYYRAFKTAPFDSALVRALNGTSWVPSGDGTFHVPSVVSFETLGWRDEPLLLSKIRFRPAEVDVLAEKVDIEAGVLDLLKGLGLTSVAAVRDRLGLAASERDDGEGVGGNAVEDAVAALGVGAPAAPAASGPSMDAEVEHGQGAGAGSGGHREPSVERGLGAEGAGERTSRRGQVATGSGKAMPFVSYVAVSTEDDADDPDGLVQAGRMALEDAAIAVILNYEGDWQRTPTHNPGFDLLKVDNGQPYAWCEVKAMKGDLQDRPATMSHAQFKYAQKRGDAYWLYLVERAGSDDVRVVRIRDPAGKAKTFTFDKGWLDVAEVD